VLNFIAEVGSSFKWVYRGWFYIGSTSYHNMVILEHSKRSKGWRKLDISMSILFMLLELFLLLQITR
jgi:phosphate starvation-inducible membrane PsiE